MAFKCVLPFLLLFIAPLASLVKVGVLIGPGNDYRETDEKLWSFGEHNHTGVILEPILKELRWWSALEVANAICQAVKGGAKALVVQGPPRMGPLLASYSSNLQIPLFTSHDPQQGSLGHYQVSLLPRTTEVAASLIHHYRWRTFAFIYDADTGPDELDGILQAMISPLPVEAFWRANSAQEASAFVRSLPAGVNQVVLATSEQMADQLFSDLAKYPRNFHGLLLKPVSSVGSSRFQDRSRLTKFSVVNEDSQLLKDFENRWKTLYDSRGVHRVTDKELPDSAVFKSDIIRILYRVFKEPSTDLVSYSESLDCFNYTVGVPANFRKQISAGPGITGPLNFSAEGRRVDSTIIVVETSNFGTKKVGTWSSAGGLQIFERVGVVAYQKSEVPIRVTSILVDPYLKLDSRGTLVGYVVDFLEELGTVVGKKFDLRLVKDGKYGIFRDGRWQGMIGELVNNETDLAVAPLTKTIERSTVVDFGKSFMTVGLNILLKKSDQEIERQHQQVTLGPFAFLTVWPLELWLVVVLLVVASGGLNYAASRYIGVPDRVRALESKGTDNLSPCGSFWFAVGTLLQRDTGIYPRSLSHRLFAIIWWSVCLVLFVFYICSITAALINARTSFTTTHSVKTSQDVLEDLLKRGAPAIGTIKSGSTPQFFKNTKIGLYQEFGQYLNENADVLTDTYAEGIARVRSSKPGEYAFLMESTSSDFEVNKLPCDTLVTSGYLTSRAYAPALQKNSKLKDLVDHGVLSMMESGTLRQLYEKWWHNFTDNCEDPNMDLLPKVYDSSLSLHETCGLFYILVLFTAVSVVAALIEHSILSKRMSLDRNPSSRLQD